MIYLEKFYLPGEDSLDRKELNIYNNYYPLGIFSAKNLNEVKFDTITIFYDGSGYKQIELAKMLKITPTLMNSYIHNKVRPSNDVLQQLADIFNCELQWLQGYNVPRQREYAVDFSKFNEDEIAKIKEYSDMLLAYRDYKKDDYEQ